MIRVCQLCSTTIDSHYFANLCRGLCGAGVSVLAGTISQQEIPAWMTGISGASYFSLKAKSRSSYPRALTQLAWLLRRERIDILQTHLFDAGMLGILAARLSGTPVLVMTRHHTDEIARAGSRIHFELDRWMARTADHVIGLSHAVRNQMTEREGHKGANVEVIYQGFDFGSLSPTIADRERVRAEFGLGSSFVLGCAASFFKTKGHAYLLSALRELVYSIPEIKLLLLGSGDRGPILAAVGKLGLEERVIFGGYRTDIAACMSAMDILVHPSETEAFCQVIIEGMATGTAVIATDVGGAAEVIQSGQNGILIPPGQPAAITQAVMTLYTDPTLLQRIAVAGQRTVRERFTVDRMVQQHLDCYNRWLNRYDSKNLT
ncbi:glycosyltransferase family 4 protein [soil metagenome]